jgi:hypothetical protein
MDGASSASPQRAVQLDGRGDEGRVLGDFGDGGLGAQDYFHDRGDRGRHREDRVSGERPFGQRPRWLRLAEEGDHPAGPVSRAQGGLPGSCCRHLNIVIHAGRDTVARSA